LCIPVSIKGLSRHKPGDEAALFIPRPLDPALHACGIAQNRFLMAGEGRRTARTRKIALNAFLWVLAGYLYRF